MGGGGREPEIERGVDAAVGEGGDLGRQAQDAAVEGGARDALGDGSELAAEREAVRDGLRGRGADLDGGPAAEAAKEHGDAARHLVEGDARVLVEGGGRIETAGEGMPELADGLFRLPGFDVEAAHARQPMTAVTRSSRPRLTSSSSVSGSIIAARIARSTGMPPAIRVAA